MNLSATILLAFGMSMDAFAASIGKGATLHKPKFSEAVRTGLIFGAIETLTPLVGWGLGMLASQFILEWNHWIAFILLVFLGGRMIVEGFRGDSDEACEAPHRHGFWLLVTTAFATSLDAMAVGVPMICSAIPHPAEPAPRKTMFCSLSWLPAARLAAISACGQETGWRRCRSHPARSSAGALHAPPARY